MNNLDKLKELTNNLPAVPKLHDLVKSADPSVHSIIYNVEDGTSFGLGLLSRPQVAVQEVFISKGTSFPLHVHDKEKEILIVYKGEMFVKINDEERLLKEGDFVEICCGNAHSTKALKDTWVIAVAIPRIDGFPK